MAPSKPLYDTTRLETLKLQTQLDIHAKAINALAFSPDGKLLASADDKGLLVIQETVTDTCIRMYKAAKPILKLVWDPSNPSLLCAGCTNGEVLKLKIDKRGEKYDIISIDAVMGWIHAMAISKMGDQIVVACGNRVEVVCQGSLQEHWGHASLLPIPKVEDGPPHPLIRDVHIVGEIILVSFFFAELGIIGYSTKKPHSEQWRLPKIEEGNLVAGSAVSPSGKRLAVANMINGVDIYDLEARNLEDNISYDIGGYCYVDVAFADDQTVVIGHPLGSIIMVTLAKISQKVYSVTVLQKQDPVQTVACTIIEGRLKIVAGSVGILEPPKVLMVTEDEDLAKKKKKRTMKRKCGCCLVQTAVGLATMAVLFAIVVPTKYLSPTGELGATLGEGHAPLLATTDRVSLGSARGTPSATHVKLSALTEGKSVTSGETKYKPVFRVGTAVTQATRTGAMTKSVIPVDTTIKPTTLVDPVVEPFIHTESTTRAIPVTKTVTSVHAIIVTVTETQATTATVTEEAPAITHTEILAATHTRILTETIVARPTGNLLAWLESCNAGLHCLFSLGVVALCILVNYTGAEDGDASEVWCENGHQCAAVAELERIREIAANAGDSDAPSMASQGDETTPDAGVEAADVTDESQEEHMKGSADNTENRSESLNEGSTTGAAGESVPRTPEDIGTNEKGKGKAIEEEVEGTEKEEAEDIQEEVGNMQQEVRSEQESAADAEEVESERESIGNEQEEVGGGAQEGDSDIQEQAIATQAAAMDATDDAVEEEAGDEEDTITASGFPADGKEPNESVEGHQQAGMAPPTKRMTRGAAKVASLNKSPWGKPPVPKPTVSKPTARKAALGKK